MKKPKIVYERVTINNANIDSFLAAQHMAKYDTGSDRIIVYDYAIDSSVDFLKKGAALQTLDFIRTMRPRSIAHEMQHWRNSRVVDNVYDFCNGNYFMEMSLYCLDELSAFTAGAFYSNPVLRSSGANARTIIVAMDEGISEFADSSVMNFYLNNISNFIRDGIDQDISEQYTNVYELIDLQKRYAFDPKSLFDHRFYDVVRAYFTFDGYCILKDRNIPSDMRDIWQSVISNCNKIKSAYLSQTNKILSEFLSSSRGR